MALVSVHESGAQLGKECCPEPNLFAVVPNAGVLGVDFCLRPNVEPSHLIGRREDGPELAR